MKIYTNWKKLLTLALVITLAVPGASTFATNRTLHELKKRTASGKMPRPKLAPDLVELLALDEEAAKDRQTLSASTLSGKRAKKLAQRTVLGNVVLPSEGIVAEEPQSFIVKLSDTASTAGLKARLAAFGGTIRQSSQGTGLTVIDAPRTAIRLLATDAGIEYVSPDRMIGASTSGYVERVSGREAMLMLSGGNKINGTDMNIAVLDSGVWSEHHNLEKRLLIAVDFTGERNTTTDPFGHGTHVASLAVSEPHVSKGAYEGLAPGARFVSLRVLNGLGQGTVSWALSAVNWLLSNAAKNRIRVVNMSFGTPALDSYKNDPLCLAVRKLVNAGIVVVVAAGNDGKDSSGKKIYGRIHSPGNEPSAITVGASNDLGTEARSDDRIATYSSRGPTRSYSVDASGVRRYDNLIKPDLVAAGNKLVAAAADQNYLLRNYPNLNARVASEARHNQMFMSGTSMAAPVVAGAAALVLQANPKLTPNLVKAVLMYTAQPLRGYNMFEQGAGLLNVAGAVQLAKLIRTDLTSSTIKGTNMLTAALPNPQANIINGETCYWGQAVIADHTFFYGSTLMTRFQGIYRLGVLLSDGTLCSNGVMLNDSALMADGVQIARGPVTVTGVVFADGVILADGVVLSDGVILADGVVLSDGIVMSDGAMLADSNLRSDAIRGLNVLVNGDNTPSMPVILDDGTAIE